MQRAVVSGTEYALSPLTDSIGFLTRVVQIQINDRIRASGMLGVSPAVFSVLRLLETNAGIRQVDAARILLIQESNMANLVKELIAQNLVERRGKNGSKRGGLWITSAGRRQLEQRGAAEATDRSYAASLSNKEYRQLIALLRRLYLASLA